MKPVTLAVYLLRIPRLFMSLFLWPILLGLLLVVGQTLLSFSVTQFGNETAESYRARKEQAHNVGWLREIVYGTEQKLLPLQLCRWVTDPSGTEVPPRAGCAIEKNHVAIRALEPETVDVEDYFRLFDGASEVLHVCKTCSGTITIDLTGPKPVSSVQAAKGLGIYFLSRNELLRSFGEKAAEGRSEMERLEDLQGDLLFYSPALLKPVNMAEAKNRMVFVLNVSMVIVVAFWLGIRAHRKVLDYFIKNGVLLPLVASCGKSATYRALWFLSLARTGVFLMLAVVPVSLSFEFGARFGSGAIFEGSVAQWTAWLGALAMGLGVLTVFVSTADLRERGEWYTVFIRFVPIIVWSIGTVAWLATVVGDEGSSIALRSVLSCIPIAGLSAVLLAPLIEVRLPVLLIHGVLSLLLVMFMLRSNTNYFASHVEEL